MKKPTRKKVWARIARLEHEDLDGTFTKAIELLTKTAKANKVTTDNIRFAMYYDYEYTNMNVEIYRMQTEQEYNSDLKAWTAKKKRADIKKAKELERDRRTYKRLKKKFEKE